MVEQYEDPREHGGNLLIKGTSWEDDSKMIDEERVWSRFVKPGSVE